MTAFKFNLSLIIFTFVLLFLSCKDETLQEDIDPTFTSYVDSFFSEAQKRDLDINRADREFTVQFGDLGGIRANGVCSTYTHDIVIHKKRWDAMSERQKQRLIFHEMGHCILDRPHTEETLANGECKSIMKGAEGDNCFSNVISDLWHEYYIDELFMPDINPPQWYVTNINPTITRTVIDTFIDRTNYLFYQPEELPNDFLVKASFVDWKANDQIELSWGNFKFLVNEVLTGLTYDNEFIYYKRELINLSTTQLGIIVKGSYTYFLLNEKIFHTMENFEPITNFSLVVNNASSNQKIAVGLEIYGIE